MCDVFLNLSFSVSCLVVYLIFWGVCVFYLVLLLVMLLISFKMLDDICIGNLLLLFDIFIVIGWFKVWDSVGVFFWNLVLIIVFGVLIFIFIGVLNGYVLLMWCFCGFQLFFGVLLFGCFLLFQVIFLLMFFIFGKFGLVNIISGLVLVYVIYGLVFIMLFFCNYFVVILDVLVKVVCLDGVGFFIIFLCILLLMFMFIVMVCLIWQFIQIWNDFLFGVVFVSGDL